MITVPLVVFVIAVAISCIAILVSGAKITDWIYNLIRDTMSDKRASIDVIKLESRVSTNERINEDRYSYLRNELTYAQGRLYDLELFLAERNAKTAKPDAAPSASQRDSLGP